MNQPRKTESHATLVVTDSGLGGLSVFARIAARLKAGAPWGRVSMVYFNAWPEQNRGYNHFPDMAQRAQVFDNALSAMERFMPDRILIACNTLSVIYPLTRFSTASPVDVTGIVDHGVDMSAEHLDADPDNQVIIFGTPTTASARSHELALVKRGFSRNRIITQGCVNLAGRIERNPFGDDVKQMVDVNVREAVGQLKSTGGRVAAALCCTHFGYCSDLFLQSMDRLNVSESIVLNPNERMADSATAWQGNPVLIRPDIDMRIVSRVHWEPERIDAYTRLLGGVSPETVAALGRYQWNEDLFTV